MTPRRTLAEWLTLQEQVHGSAIDLGLGRVGEVARALGVDRPGYRVITVGGTNGKGSTCICLEAMLEASGVRTGLLTSPHLLRYNERIHVDGREATDAELVTVFERIEAARGNTTLTFFEYNTLAGLLLFADARVDVAVLEVGLGGRLDAVNVVDADVGVVCSVGFDHRDWLGDTLAAIGREKAGIFRPGRPAVLGTPDMPPSVYDTIGRLGARVVVAGRDVSWTVRGDRWDYLGLSVRLIDLPRPALQGEVQFRNAATALAAIESLPSAPRLDAAGIGAALAGLVLPGRFQLIPSTDGAPEWVLDVAHNEPAARVLADNLNAHPVPGRTIAVCGILQDKDAAAIARVMAGCAQEWIVCGLPGPRGTEAAALAARLSPAVQATALVPTVAAGLELARARAVGDDRVLVFGSFITVAAALEWLSWNSAPRKG